MADFRTRSEMGSENDFIQALERLVSGNANIDSSASGTYETGINRPLGRLSRNTDALLDAVQTAKNCILDPANADIVVEYTSGDELYLTGTTGVYIRTVNNVGSAAYNQISSSGSALVSSLVAGNVLYVQLDRTSNATKIIQRATDWAAYLTASNISAGRLDFLIFGVVTAADTLVLFNGTTIRKGERLENGLATDTQYASRFNVQQNANIFMTGGGGLSFDTSAGNEFTIGSTLTISVPGGGSGNGSITIASGNYSIDDGQAFYVTDLNRDATAGAVIPASGAIDGITISNTTRDLFVIAYRSGSVLYLANGASIQDGETYRLASSPVYALTTADESSGALTPLDGTLTLKSAAGTVVDGSASTSHIRIRNRRDNLQVSIGTTLEWSTSTSKLKFTSNLITDGIFIRHPDYTDGSTVYENRINHTISLSGFTINDGECAYVALATATSGHQNHTTITGTPGNTPGFIYVHSIKDVSEIDADIFVFAYRIGTKLYLWDGTFLEGDGGGSLKTKPGTNHDRLILSQQYRYYHEDIVFTFDQSGTDKVQVQWGSEITLYWPSGGESIVNADTIDLTAALPVIRVTIPESDRASSGSASFSAAAVARSAVNSTDDIILFELTAVASGSVSDALTQPVKVFGGRKVHQNYEVSGGATAGTTGHVNLGRDSTLTMLGQKSISEGLWYGSYPSASNPFVTASHDGTLRIGEYSGAEYEGGSATFSPKFTVTGSSGAVVSNDSVQGTDFTFGTNAGAAQTKKRVVFLSALDIFRQLDGTDDKLYTSDEGGGSATPTVEILKHAGANGALTTGGNTGPAMHALELSSAEKIRFPAMLPVGCKLSKVTLFWNADTGSSSMNLSFLRVSRSRQIHHAIATGSYAEGDLNDLLTNGSSVVAKNSEDFVDPSSESRLGPVKKAIFDFDDNTVSDGTDASTVAARTSNNPLGRLYIALMQESGADRYLIGVSIEYTASSAAALLGIEDA